MHDDILRSLDQLHIEVLVKFVLLFASIAARLVLGKRRAHEDRREIQSARLPVLHGAVDIQQLLVSDRLVDRPEAQFGE